jgi:antitoxin component YwqK of YwqJK toxin-antitoxin module
MHYSFRFLLLGSLTFILTGCLSWHAQESNVVSEKYLHKYGYSVSKREFEENQYPGQVITTLKSGVTISSTYEDGVLHGATTYTFPHSQIIETYYIYSRGECVKEIRYNSSGIPLKEEVKTSSSGRMVTSWYTNGVPSSIEEYEGFKLVGGKYFSIQNELESSIIKGVGVKTIRGCSDGVLIERHNVDQGYPYRKEVFYPNGFPKTIAYCNKGTLHGEKREFNENGEPLLIEEYVNGRLHGKSSSYKNGILSVVIHYLDGLKNGPEIHYFDNGQDISQEIPWENDRKHGLCKYFIDGEAQIEYFYNGIAVNEDRWKELSQLDHVVNQISSNATW